MRDRSPGHLHQRLADGLIYPAAEIRNPAAELRTPAAELRNPAAEI